MARISNFKGTNRRFEKKGTFNGVTVIDDYAHHPDEIRATLNSAAHYPHNRVWVVFQPHTYNAYANEVNMDRVVEINLVHDIFLP